MLVTVIHICEPPVNSAVRTVRSVERAVDALEGLARHHGPMTLAQLAEVVHAPKSTMLNIVRTLVQRRLLDFDAGTKTYRMGYLLAGLASGSGAATDLRAVAAPHLEALAGQVQETVFLAVFEQREIRFVEKIDCLQPIRYAAQIGTRRPLHCTAGGKLSLALQPAPVVDAYVREVGLARYTPSTITTVPALQAELERIRRRGYAVSDGEFLPDLTGLAVPVLDETGGALAAVIVVAGPTFRVRRRIREIVAVMQGTAAAVAHDLARLGGAPESEKGAPS